MHLPAGMSHIPIHPPPINLSFPVLLILCTSLPLVLSSLFVLKFPLFLSALLFPPLLSFLSCLHLILSSPHQLLCPPHLLSHPCPPFCVALNILLPIPACSLLHSSTNFHPLSL